MRGLWKYIRPYSWYILLTLFVKFIGTALELLIPYFMEIILDEKVPAGDRGSIFLFGGLMLGCAFGCLVFNIAANRMSAISAGRITRRLRHDLFDRLQRLSARQMDELTVSSAESRLTSDTYNINQFLARMQRLGIRAPILLFGGILMMLSMDPMLSLVMVAMLPPIGIVVYLVTKKSVPLYTEEQGVLDETVQVLQENITGVRVIKALSKSDYERARFGKVNDRLTKVDRRAGLITAITNPATSFVLNLGLTFVVLFGAMRVNGGLTDSGVIIAFLQYFVMITNAMLGITRIFVLWSKGEASARRVSDVLATPEDMLPVPDGETPDEQAPHIEFDDVSFSYSAHADRDAGENISHLSFSLRRGERLGILGETGAGKSTVFHLLLRMYDPKEGTIRIGGRDVRTIPTEELRGMFGAVFQNDFVLAGTMEDNVRFFRDLPDGAVQNAVRDAQAAEFIAAKGGLTGEVAVRGNNLSGGQKQRLLIARALAGDPEILLLDDASSALDYRTDADLRRALREGHRNATVLTVAQRVSSIRNCDRILVLSDGKTIGYGTHDELMATCEEYRAIALSQMGDGEDDAPGKEAP